MYTLEPLNTVMAHWAENLSCAGDFKAVAQEVTVCLVGCHQARSPTKPNVQIGGGWGEFLVSSLQLGFPLFLLTLPNKQGLSASLGPLPPKHKGSRWPYGSTVCAPHKVGGRAGTAAWHLMSTGV